MYLEEAMYASEVITGPTVGWNTVAEALVDLGFRVKRLETEDIDQDPDRGELRRLRAVNDELREENKRLRSRLQMMQAGYNAIATIQARLDANEQEMGGHRCCTG